MNITEQDSGTMDHRDALGKGRQAQNHFKQMRSSLSSKSSE